MAVTESERIGGRDVLKRVLFGRRQPTSRMEHTLLPKVLALPIFASDALSSNAYATEQIMVVLLAASAASRNMILPIAFAIAALMAVVVASYVQICKGYPSGGGAYVVAKDNLGTLPALIGAAALLVDYILTVAVSVVAGVIAILGAVQGLAGHAVELSIGAVVLLTVANLRGVRETGALFAFPSYAFIASILAMLILGFVRCVGGCPSAAGQHVQAIEGLSRTLAPVGLFVILHAFSSGATALTGVEAISNAIPAFKRPQSRNAQRTLVIMGVASVVMFLGISLLATHIRGVVPPATGERSVVGQIAFAVFRGGFGFYAVQIFTAGILVLAANTAYQGFPRLLAILAQDRFVARQFRNLGDRLVFSNGVIVLSVLAAALIVAFHASLDRLIQLYVVGVFTAFTLSQAGMVRHWLKVRRRNDAKSSGWRRSMIINLVGAALTGIVLVITAATKFKQGAWISIAAMPVIVLIMHSINRHYSAVRGQLRGRAVEPHTARNHVVLLVPDLDAATAEALGYIRSFRPTDLHALHMSTNGFSVDLADRWLEFTRGGPELEPFPREDGSLTERVRAYLEGIPRDSGDFATVVIPELIEKPSLFYLLRHPQLIRLKASLLRERRIAVTDAPVVLSEGRPVGVDALPFAPERTVALVFVSGVNDATIRAVNYARSLEALETRAVYFALDHGEVEKVVNDWFERRPGVALDIVDAPFRDLTGPMLQEVRKHTAQPNTVVALVIPELVPRKRLHYLLHRQTALFVKRLFLFEERVVLTSVPYHLE
ncbi:MAG: APC family permease [Actinomycetota bacterium]